MNKTTIYYRVVNSRDGGAYPDFFSTQELRDYDGSQDDERFCDDTGSLTIEHDGEITVPKVQTPVSYLFNSWTLQGNPDLLDDFVARFALPVNEYTYEPVDPEDTRDYIRLRVLHEGAEIAQFGVNAKSWAKAGCDFRTYLRVSRM